MPQIDQQIASHIENGYQKGQFDKQLKDIKDELEKSIKKNNESSLDQSSKLKKDLQTNSDEVQRSIQDLTKKLES